MVANTQLITERFGVPPAQVLSGRSRLMRFTRKELAELVRIGIVPEDASTELLNGFIVLTDRSAQGEDIWRVGRSHRITVERLSRLSQILDNAVRHVECQQPLACADENEPQPDFMVVRGRLDDLDEDYPAAADAFCVVEVADSSYERDAGEKLIGYALAGIAQYIIISLRNRTAEVYSNPDTTAGTYPPPMIISADETLPVRTGEADTFMVPLADLLP